MVVTLKTVRKLSNCNISKQWSSHYPSNVCATTNSVHKGQKSWGGCTLKKYIGGFLPTDQINMGNAKVDIPHWKGGQESHQAKETQKCQVPTLHLTVLLVNPWLENIWMLSEGNSHYLLGLGKPSILFTQKCFKEPSKGTCRPCRNTHILTPQTSKDPNDSISTCP